jgi:hypothetical protein
MRCPKCAYERKPDDTAPEHECPNCGIIYAKYRERAAPAVKRKRAEPKPPSATARLLATKAGKRIAWLLVGVILIALVNYFLGMPFTALAVLTGLFIWAVLKAIEGSRQQEKARQALLPYQHCMTCGHDFKYRTSAMRGSNKMELALWVLLLWPFALVYSIWRRLGPGKAKTACIVCASDQVVPATSPAAIAHKRALGIQD